MSSFRCMLFFAQSVFFFFFFRGNANENEENRLSLLFTDYIVLFRDFFSLTTNRTTFSIHAQSTLCTTTVYTRVYRVSSHSRYIPKNAHKRGFRRQISFFFFFFKFLLREPFSFLVRILRTKKNIRF